MHGRCCCRLCLSCSYECKDRLYSPPFVLIEHVTSCSFIHGIPEVSLLSFLKSYLKPLHSSHKSD